MTRRVLLAIGVALVFGAAVHAQDGLRSASLPERPIASPPPGPADLFRATPGTYLPHERPDHPDRPRPPVDGRGSGPGHPGRGGGSWPSTGWGYWPYYPEPEPAPTSTRGEREPGLAGGRLQLRVAPGDALVYIDGGFEGAADDLREPGALLRPGSHRVRVEARGFATHTFDVRVDDGETVTHRAALERAPRSRESAAPPLTRSSAAPPAQTLYVIPRCYAGNKPPDPTTRCDLTQLRTIR